MIDLPDKFLEDLPLFTGERQYELFPRLRDVVRTRDMSPAPKPYDFPSGDAVELPAEYEFLGELRSTEQFLSSTDTAAVLVLQNGRIQHEYYALTGGRDVRWPSFSVAKSFVSALVGIALSEGLFGGISDNISDYVEVRPGSAYDGVSIKDVLQMSSGCRWSEDYSDPDSEVFAMRGSLDECVATRVSEFPPGTISRYNSCDTQILGSLVARVSGMSVSEYMQEKLCVPIGMESPGYWLIDAVGMEVAYAGLNLTARDFAKLAELYRAGGIWQGTRILPAAWVQASITAEGAHCKPGRVVHGRGQSELGYGYQWWVPASTRGEFMALGAYNQVLYVDPSTGVTVTKLSANPAFGTSPDERTQRHGEHLAFARAVSRSFDSR